MRRLLKTPLIIVLAAFIGCGDDEPTNAGPNPDGVITTTMVSQIDPADWRIDPSRQKVRNSISKAVGLG